MDTKTTRGSALAGSLRKPRAFVVEFRFAAVFGFAPHAPQRLSPRPSTATGMG